MSKFSGIAKEICNKLGFTEPSFIGEGQFKEVFETIDRRGTTVALKVFDPVKCDLCRAEREISAMIQCTSPYIGRLYQFDIYTPHGLPPHLYTIEEFFGGGSLKERIEGLRENVVDILNIGIALLEGVSHLRGRRLVHRDIKPDNIMFRDGDGSPVLVDFGLVRDLSGTSLTHTYLSQGPGTPFFASPEQLNNEKSLIDWRTDQFAIGVVLSICITGLHPYGEPDSSPINVVNNVLSRSPQAQTFVEKVNSLGLLPLKEMTCQWPVMRFGTPKKAIDALQRSIERNSI